MEKLLRELLTGLFFGGVCLPAFVGAVPAPSKSKLTPLPLVSLVGDRYELFAVDQQQLNYGEGEMNRALEQFKAAMGVEPPKVTVIAVHTISEVVVYSQTPEGQRADLVWATYMMAKEGQENSKKDEQENKVLSHEIGHKLLSLYMNVYLAKGKPQSVTLPTANPFLSDWRNSIAYGHPQVPDWLDEALAMMCESPAEKNRRRRAMRKLVKDHLSLTKLFVMKHPMLAMFSFLGAEEEMDKKWKESSAEWQKNPEEAINWRKTLQFNKSFTGDYSMLMEQMGDAIVFYVQSLSVLEFIFEQEGSTFIRKITEGLADGRTMEDLLKGAKKIPSDVGELEKAWVAYVNKGERSK